MSGDLPSVYRDDQVMARKTHRCCECRRAIRPGERYNRFTGCWDGKWDTFVTCEECDELRRELADDDGPPFGELSDCAHNADVEFPIRRTIPGTSRQNKAATD